MHRLAALAVALTLPVAADAADCAAAYDFDTMLNDLDAAEQALQGKNYAELIQVGGRMRDGLACLDQVLPVVVAPRVYRAIGAGLYIEGDEAGERWLRAAAYLDPQFAYTELPAEHPMIRAWQTAVEQAKSDAVELAGATLGDGKHYLDGKRVNYPAATPDAIHVYQRDFEGLHSWVIDGNAFPAESAGAPVVAAAPEPEPIVAAPDPEPVVAPPSGPTVVKTSNWPAERVVLLGGGAVAVAGGGVLYALSAGARSNFDDANTVDDLDRYMAQTNTLAVASGVSFAAGASAVGFGALFFVIDGDWRPTLDLRF